MPRRTNPAPRSLARALALVVLIVLGGLLDSIHRAQVSHTVCAEHGEILHGAAVHGEMLHGEAVHGDLLPAEVSQRVGAHDAARCGAHAADAAHVATAPRGTQAERPTDAATAAHPVRVAPSNAPASAHEHCPVAMLLRDVGSAWAETAPAGFAAAEATPIVPPWPDAVVLARSPLSFAPKHSPPARG